MKKTLTPLVAFLISGLMVKANNIEIVEAAKSHSATAKAVIPVKKLTVEEMEQQVKLVTDENRQLQEKLVQLTNEKEELLSQVDYAYLMHNTLVNLQNLNSKPVKKAAAQQSK